MPSVLRGLFTLARPGNALMAAGGALAGGLAAPGDPHVSSMLVGMAATVLGVAGGNALNDAMDADIDVRAHPSRPIPRGDLSVALARAAGLWFFALSLAFLAMVNPSALVLGVVFAGGLTLYEGALKARGLVGNLAVSLLVGGTFVLGALSSQTAPLSWDRWPRAVGTGVLVMALLAIVANLAREVYKDLQDAAFDVAWRRTLPHRFGPRTSYTIARACLLAAIGLGLAAAFVGIFPPVYALLVAPALTVFAVTVFVKDPTRASFLTKVGMSLALVVFVALALI